MVGRGVPTAPRQGRRFNITVRPGDLFLLKTTIRKQCGEWNLRVTNPNTPGIICRFAVSFPSIYPWKDIETHFFEALYLTEYNARASFTPDEKARPLSPQSGYVRRLHAHRAARRHRNHRDPRCDAVARACPRQSQSAANRMHQ